MKKVLVIDDDEKICWAFEQFLIDENYQPIIANNAEEGLRQISDQQPKIVFLDVRLPGMNGLEALEHIKSLQSNIHIVIMSAYDNVETTITAMRLQAFDFLPKPIDLEKVKEILEQIENLEDIRDRLEDSNISESFDPRKHRLIGKSPQMQSVYKMIGIMASNKMIVLIEGENGTGKELVARAIHENSARRSGRFVAVNCGAIPDDLLESELFGYDAGAFTGANTKGKLGKFEIADGGTLFLDEIGNMSPALQVKLQRALQESEIERLGAIKPIKIDVRVIAATSQDLAEAVKNNNFREDLYYRFKRVLIKLPPLRDRLGDLTLLIDHFLAQISAELDQQMRGISETAIELFKNYNWRGNVRELENAIKSAAAISRSDVILPEHLPIEIQRFTPTDLHFQKVIISELRQIVRHAIAHEKKSLYAEISDLIDETLLKIVIGELDGNHSRSAILLGMSRTTLIQKLKRIKM